MRRRSMHSQILAALVAVLAVAIAACSSPSNTTPNAAVVTDDRGVQVSVSDTSRIVTAGGSVTEIIFALGAGPKVVGADASSTFPQEVAALPQIGYYRTLSAEGVLSLEPSLVIATTDAGPPNAIAQIESAGVPVLVVSAGHGVDAARSRIRTIALALGHEQRGEDLVRAMDGDLGDAREILARSGTQPRVLFLLARGSGTLHAAGTKTAADEMIVLAGGRNAITEYEGYRPLSAEAVVAAEPEVLLISEAGIAATGGLDALLSQPGISLTPAASSRRIVILDDLYLLGFGLRTGAAVRDLASRLHPQVSISNEQARVVTEGVR